jgi:hypothetical protein
MSSVPGPRAGVQDRSRSSALLAALGRHLEGWQLGVVAVGIAAASAALVLPRAVVPRELPLPAVDWREQQRDAEKDEERAARAEHDPVPYLVRAAGEAFRRFGAAEYARDDAAAEKLRRDFVASFAEAEQHHGPEALLTLRAVQAALFVRAVNTARSDATPSRDVIELGGGFHRRARLNGWLGPDGLDPDALACLFAVRWTRLAGALERHPFSPSLNQWRLYFRTLLEHPEAPATTSRDALAYPELLSAYVGVLSKRDPDYPVLLAEGILAYRSGRYVAAQELLAAHLRQRPEGPWHLRAQNYLVAAYQRAR